MPKEVYVDAGSWCIQVYMENLLYKPQCPTHETECVKALTFTWFVTVLNVDLTGTTVNWVVFHLYAQKRRNPWLHVLQAYSIFHIPYTLVSLKLNAS